MSYPKVYYHANFMLLLKHPEGISFYLRVGGTKRPLYKTRTANVLSLKLGTPILQTIMSKNDDVVIFLVTSSQYVTGVIPFHS